MVNNINSGMKIIHYKSFFLSMSSQTGCNLFLPNGHYAVPPPLPLFLAMASIGIVLESSQVISTAPSVSGPSAVAPFAAPNLTIPQGYGSPSSSTANSRSMSNNLARYAWTLVQPWLETLQRAADSVAAPLALLDPAALTVLLTLRTLLWRSGLFLRLDASRNLLNAAISLAFRLGCGNPRSLIVPPLRGNPTGAQLYAYYKSQLIAESIRRAFWSLYIHDRTLAVLDAGPFVIPDEVAWEMNLPCLEADFDLVSETLVAIEVGMEAVAPELREQLLNSVHWEVLPRDLLWKPFRAHRVMGNPLPADPIQKRFTANIAVTFVIGKANAFHVHARSLGVELFDPRCDPASPPVRSLVVELQRTVARIRGFFDKLPDWYMELDADPVGFVERQLGLPLENRLPIDTVYAGCTDLLILRLACVLVHGPAKPDPTDPAHIAWLTLARNSPNHLWSIAQTMPPLHDYPDLSKRPRYPLLPICAVEGPEYSVLELCLHHTLRMIGLFRALALVDPLGVRHSVLVHHAVVQAAVYRVVLALGCVTQDPVLGPFEAGSRPTGSLDQAFEEALVDVEFIESQLATFKTTHVAKGLSKEVVSAVKKQLIEWRVQLVELQAEPAVYSASLGSVQGSPRGSAASRSFAEDADDAGDIETITTNAARSGFLSEGMAALIARMGSGWNT